MSRRALRVAVIGVAGDRRVELLQDALRRLGWPSATFVGYESLLADSGLLPRALECADAVRIESPGGGAELERLLVARGADIPDDGLAHRISARTALGLVDEPGCIRFTRQWYLGFVSVLRTIARAIADRPGIVSMSQPEDIALMFDKPRCAYHLSEGGVPTPQGLGVVYSWDELHDHLARHRTTRVFLKPRHGSSASGVLALRVARGRCRAMGPLELERSGSDCRLFNSLRVRAYDREADLRAIVDCLGRDGLWVERWLPKASLDGYAFDARIVTIAGQARHTTLRLSRTPITNLHLANARAHPERLIEAGWSAALAEMRQAAEAAARALPASHHVGVDVMVAAGFRHVAVLELNAFGDLLPGTLHDGQDTYEAELVALAA